MPGFSYMDDIVAAGKAGSGSTTGASGGTDWFDKITGALPAIGSTFASVYGAVRQPNAPAYQEPTPQARQNNTMIYLGLGLVGLIVIMFVMKKK